MIADDLTEDPNSRRVRIETRKWLLSRLRPDKYGDRTQVDVQTRVTVDYSMFTTEELEFVERIQKRLAAKKAQVIDVKPEIGAPEDDESSERTPCFGTPQRLRSAGSLEST